MNETLITFGITVVLISLTVIPYFKKFRKKESKAREKLHQMKISGLQEAQMVHPQIDAMMCIGCAACVRACPEGEVLGIIEGKAVLIHGAKCIGHGMCAEACPVGAIELLMAQPGRSANLPVVDENYETNIPGMFIIGELGGLGLIKNAITQGTNVVRYITSLPHSSIDDVNDIAIIGAGPAGFACGLTSIEQNLRYVVLEQNNIGGTVFQYPRAKIVMTSPVELPLWGKVKLTETKKEALLDLWHSIIEKTGLKIQENEKVTNIAKGPDYFTITSTSQEWKAKYVILALGRRGTPRKLQVQGENLPKVLYRLIDTSTYNNTSICIVGGGDSAIEAAVGLASQKNNVVTLSYRKGEFTRIKERNRVHIEDFVKRKKIRVIYYSEVKEIREKEVLITTDSGEMALPNDLVFVFAGGELPYDFLNKIGIQMHMQQIQ